MGRKPKKQREKVTCSKCGNVQQTRANAYWCCINCGEVNDMNKTPIVGTPRNVSQDRGLETPTFDGVNDDPNPDVPIEEEALDPDVLTKDDLFDDTPVEGEIYNCGDCGSEVQQGNPTCLSCGGSLDW